MCLLLFILRQNEEKLHKYTMKMKYDNNNNNDNNKVSSISIIASHAKYFSHIKILYKLFDIIIKLLLIEHIVN